MTYLWHPATNNLETTSNADAILCLLMDGYVEISKKLFDEIAATKRRG